ncbi:hypothetical protein NA57DRAFT_77789 [Rhizodiscina lignyota]|uniref:Uncharacterized protein n=1 Tax=Rhizodiscina lignyota TaxID=1504668 RepID=A0A9P4IFH0_9PEZI|nr:hypothetical protein NA57DRAFT_77789 [Rhizodiscina lignyota]
MPSKTSELDLISNKANLLNANLQQILGRVSGASSSGDGKHDQDREEDEAFGAVSELGGLGSHRDIAAELKQKAQSSEDGLRKQLLGKNAKAGLQSTVSNQKHSTVLSRTGKKHRNHGLSKSDDSDEETGRASSFKKKRTAPRQTNHEARMSTEKLDKDQSSEAKAEYDAEQGSPSLALPHEVPMKHRPAMSYLDEVLEQKAKKRKKKKRKNNSEHQGPLNSST